MIKINNLNFSYDNTRPFLIENINLEILSGDYVVINGENGSCKSTFIKLLLNLIKPQSGQVNISTKKISYIPQKLESFNSQFPITVEEVLITHQNSLKIAKDLSIDEVLNLVSLKDKKKSLLGSLSGGQQQRVLIARMLLGDPDLLILDEPSSGIDKETSKEMYSLLENLNKKGKTIIIIEHNLANVMQHCNKILKVNKGTFKLYKKQDFREEYYKEGN